MCLFLSPTPAVGCLELESTSEHGFSAWSWTGYSSLSLLSKILRKHSEITPSLCVCAWCVVASPGGFILRWVHDWRACLRAIRRGKVGGEAAFCLIPPLFAAWGHGDWWTEIFPFNSVHLISGLNLYFVFKVSLLCQVLVLLVFVSPEKAVSWFVKLVELQNLQTNTQVT